MSTRSVTQEDMPAVPAQVSRHVAARMRRHAVELAVFVLLPLAAAAAVATHFLHCVGH